MVNIGEIGNQRVLVSIFGASDGSVRGHHSPEFVPGIEGTSCAEVVVVVVETADVRQTCGRRADMLVGYGDEGGCQHVQMFKLQLNYSRTF